MYCNIILKTLENPDSEKIGVSPSLDCKNQDVSIERTFNTDEKKYFIKYSYNFSNYTCLKPNGFWYSINGEWQKWVNNEMTLRKYNHPIVFKKNSFIGINDIHNTSRILSIKNLVELNLFIDRYLIKTLCIDWFKVSSHYAGIEILFNPREIPEILSNNKYTWFYSWDVASGCIWDIIKVIDYSQLVCSICGKSTCIMLVDPDISSDYYDNHEHTCCQCGQSDCETLEGWDFDSLIEKDFKPCMIHEP